ncbi:hypothetical protein FIS3754_44370 [Fischerella sp. NIES-3754]|nr:hypothetical protein FIS3754_44370 [Fischerella sp. NIES-3754]BCX10870.1 MAG: hypothetical protein KatS3mg066_4729 [Fischerella sp.]
MTKHLYGYPQFKMKYFRTNATLREAAQGASTPVQWLFNGYLGGHKLHTILSMKKISLLMFSA